MEATLLSCPRLPHRPFLKKPSYSLRHGIVTKVVVAAKKDDNEAKSSPVDESMSVLRLHIKKMKVLESSRTSQKPSSDWMEWEKRIFTRYQEDVCEAMALLQTYLMNTRPSVALGVLALVAMSIPLSSSRAMVNVLKITKGLLEGCHVCIDIEF
ncbi:mediator of RNA polymerase II transcription subunit [Olea europaea subsp. europaea]|uniref:Mediator of RNA polymerase II transcription subunit n=1 Tax=Olea europaea subsp. europaea TaxID=158383 RepID=A0A8S0SWI8_OLEEU|nr:mediator of RNA polymerase II transcription subunit [Olea europaea subsp. europaea]